MEYRLVRSKRKTVAIVVDREGGVEVRAPLKTPLPVIERFVEQKRDWIAEKAAAARARAELRRAFQVEIGGTAALLGREYPVRAGKRAAFSKEGFTVNPEKPVKPQLVGVYRSLARAHLTERTACYARQLGVRPAAIRITGASTRFGSCSGRDSLSFTWKLMLADPALVDYVVVHELAHIRQHNHSAQFWAEVEAAMPDYRERERRLSAFGRSLLEQDW